MGTRQVPFGRELYIEREDFMEEPPKKYFRLFPGNEVRLMGAYFVKCESYEKDEAGNVTVVHCTYDPASRGGNSPDGRKVKGTIHWVSAAESVKAEVRLYENIIDEEKGVYNEDGSLSDCGCIGRMPVSRACTAGERRRRMPVSRASTAEHI